jgi:hypothetical protein
MILGASDISWIEEVSRGSGAGEQFTQELLSFPKIPSDPDYRPFMMRF